MRTAADFCYYRKAAGADEIVHEFLKYIPVRRNAYHDDGHVVWIRKKRVHIVGRWREGAVSRGIIVNGTYVMHKNLYI